MIPNDALGQHLHTFFHEYLTTQRAVSPHTVLAYRDAFKLFLCFVMERHGRKVEEIALSDLGVDTVLDFLAYLEHDRQNSVVTRNARLAALHTFYRHVAARDPTSFDLCQRVLGIPTKRTDKSIVNYLEHDEMDIILRSIDRKASSGRRDYALIAFAYQTGARVQEIITLRACDLQFDVLAQVRILGKGRKERIIPLWAKTADLLRALLDERKVDPRSNAVVFVNARGRPLTRWGVRYILRIHADVAGLICPTVAQKNVHPHIIRHTMAIHMLEAGADTSVIRDLLGHESAETTWRYTRVGMEMKRKIMEASAAHGAVDAPKVPVWRRNSDLLAQLEAIGR